MKARAQMPPRGTSLASVPLPNAPGTWGVCPGFGPIAAIIRRATNSWAGHAVIYVGGGQIVEATWPRVRISDAPTSNVMWASKQPLTAKQRNSVVVRADSLIGDGYDIFV